MIENVCFWMTSEPKNAAGIANVLGVIIEQVQLDVAVQLHKLEQLQVEFVQLHYQLSLF